MSKKVMAIFFIYDDAYSLKIIGAFFVINNYIIGRRHE